MSWSEREEDLVQEAVDLIWREHGRVNGTPCYEAALHMLQCARAAEERGRRRGVEAILPIIRGCQADLRPIAVQKNLAGDVARLVIEKLNAAVTFTKLDAALAPRDSAPVCDAVLSSDPFREWRCGKPKGHEGPHSGDRK